MAEALAEISDILKQGEDLVLARIVKDRGPTPRSSGARMIVKRNGEIIGTIGGGQVEATAIRIANGLFENGGVEIAELDMTSDDASGEDMICGGKVTVLCEHVAANNESISVFESLAIEHAGHRRVALCTKIKKLSAGVSVAWRLLLGKDVHDDEAMSPDLMQKLLEISGTFSGAAMFDIEGEQYLIDIVESAASLFIFGAGHVAREVSALACAVGFRTVVFDDRPEFANARRFPPPAKVVVLESFDGCIKRDEVDEDSYVVIVTRGHSHDKTVLAQALRTRAGYIGMIGSRNKRDAIYKALLSEGFSDDGLSRVHCPIGLPIKTETPEEIAVSIVGELIDVRSRKRNAEK